MPLTPSIHLRSPKFKVCDLPTHMKLEPAEGELAVAGIVLDGGDTILIELDFFADSRHVGVYVDKAGESEYRRDLSCPVWGQLMKFENELRWGD